MSDCASHPAAARPLHHMHHAATFSRPKMTGDWPILSTNSDGANELNGGATNITSDNGRNVRGIASPLIGKPLDTQRKHQAKPTLSVVCFRRDGAVTVTSGIAAANHNSLVTRLSSSSCIVGPPFWPTMWREDRATRS
jgi:hypothetical protein